MLKNNFCTVACLLAYLFCSTFPRFPRFGLFMAVMNAFFNLIRRVSCSDLHSINEGLLPHILSLFFVVCICPDNQLLGCNGLFMDSSLLSSCKYCLRQFIPSLDSKGERFNRDYILYRLTSSSALTLYIQRKTNRSFLSRC